MIASTSVDLLSSENTIRNYVQNHICTKQNPRLEFDLRQWDQHMINAFYNYCLKKSVLPSINLVTQSQLQLVGSISDVEQAVTKCKLMCEISKQKYVIESATPSIGRSTVSKKVGTTQSSLDGYNIYFSYCQFDQSICHQLLRSLADEGYRICRKSSDNVVSIDDLKKSDVVLVAFSEAYLKDPYCMTELNHAKLARKNIISFIVRDATSENQWLSSLTIADSFYELFEREIDLEFTDDYDLEYDQLLTTLVSMLVSKFSILWQ